MKFPYKAKFRIAEIIAKLMLWYGRGKALADPVMDIVKLSAYGSMLIIGIKTAFGISLGKEFFIIFVPAFIFGYLMLGFFDDKLFKIWHFTNSYLSFELNPFFKQMAEDIKKIKEKFKI